MPEWIGLEDIDPNPWQPRQGEDPEHIKKLALSIVEDGLMQVPVGRWTHPDGKLAPDITDIKPDYQATYFIDKMLGISTGGNKND